MRKYGWGIEKVTILSGLLFVALLVSYASTAAAPAKPYYAGKVMRVLVPVPAGGGYDAYARLLARYLGKHLPGNPTTIVENQTGTFRMANTLFNVTKPDGLTIGTMQAGTVVAQLLDQPGVQFDFNKFRPIGSMDSNTQGVFVRAESGIRTLDDLRKANPPLVTDAHRQGGIIALSAGLAPMLELMGFSVKVPVGGGTPSAAQKLLAFERKEIDIYSVEYSTILSTKRYWLEGKPFITFLMHYGACRPPSHPLLDPLLKGLPCISNVATDPRVKAILKVWKTISETGRAFYAPPGTPDNVLEVLRGAFDKAMQDPGLVSEAEKLGLSIAPTRGEEIHRLEVETLDLKKTDPEAVKKINDIYGVQK